MSSKDSSGPTAAASYSSLSIACLVLLVFQTSLSTIFMRYSRAMRPEGETGAPAALGCGNIPMPTSRHRASVLFARRTAISRQRHRRDGRIAQASFVP
eukprot:3397238-Prymnesium_polylepis.1